MKINLMSDLHLEFIQNENDIMDVGSGDVLLLCGDILVSKYVEKSKIYNKFLSECSKNYEKVLYIFGNHEYYGGDIVQVDAWLPNYISEKFNNITVLNGTSYTLNDAWIVVGATLWTNYNDEDPLVMLNTKRSLNDFQRITFSGKSLRPEFIVDLNKEHLQAIKNTVSTNANKNIIVMTHHAPSSRSIHEVYRFSVINGAYANNLDNFISENTNIKYWLHGHTHFGWDYKINQCRVICNPYGYFNYDYEENYSPKSLTIT